ncbi:DNA polymerase III subunit delta [uncultured Gammaproteobacteria bacterium]
MSVKIPTPRDNPHLVGHEAAENLLREAWAGGRLHHAWLIGGPAGIGKATLAFRFARFVLAYGTPPAVQGPSLALRPAFVPSPSPLPSPSLSPARDSGARDSGGLFGPALLPVSSKRSTPSGAGRAVATVSVAPPPPSPLSSPPPPVEGLALELAHPVFRRVVSGGHPDLVTIELRFDEKRNKMKTEIMVEDVREIVRFLHRTTASGGWRVVVVDGVERMNASGLNAILKILEEPPPGALLLLVTETPGGLLPTIRSRCRRLTLGPLSETVVLGLLGRYRPDLDQGEQLALARLADGAVGRALALADAGGLAVYREIVTLLAPLPRLDPAAVHAFADKVGRRGSEALFDTVANLMVWWLRRLARAAALAEVPSEVVPGEADLVRRLLAIGGDGRWLGVWENLAPAFARAGWANLDNKQVMLNALLAIQAAA